jgi:hypothetical protein
MAISRSKYNKLDTAPNVTLGRKAIISIGVEWGNSVQKAVWGAHMFLAWRSRKEPD